MVQNDFTGPLKSYLCFVFTLFALLPVSGFAAKKQQIDLSGEWLFKIDRGDVGVSEKWFKTDLPDKIKLPGSLQEQGYGNDVTAKTSWIADSSGVGPMTDAEMGYEQVKSYSKYPNWFLHPMYEKYRNPDDLHFPYWLQPEKHYVGPAWYQRKIYIPSDWKDKRVTLELERCHWKSDVWIDKFKVGTNDSLVTPHVYDLTDYLHKTGKHTLTIRIDNSMIYTIGYNSHIVSDHTQSAWNGIIGEIALKAEPLIWIDDVQVFPDVKRKKATVKITLGKRIDKDVTVNLNLSACSYNSDKKHSPDSFTKEIMLSKDSTLVKIDYSMGNDVQLWDEFSPSLYNLKVETFAVNNKNIGKDNKTISFGMRNAGTKGTRVTINSREIFLRGIEECCVFPLTGYPPTDVESWREIMQVSKNYGMNHLRFHSWCPPEAAFLAADLEGVYIEVSYFWAKLNKERDYQFFRRETRRGLKEYGNHPSLVLLSPGQECGGLSSEQLVDMLRECKDDGRHLYSGPGNSNWLLTPKVEKEYDYYAARHYAGHRTRYQAGWPPKPYGSYFTSKPPQTDIDYEEGINAFGKPLITYEVVQRCSYPDLESGYKYTGPFKPGYIQIAKDQLKERGMSDQVQDFITASGMWQIQQFKEEIEAVLRTEGVAGFQLLGIQDFPGQGGALVGVIDAFWDDKSYIKKSDFRQFCDLTVPLARMKKRLWQRDEHFKADIEIANFAQHGFPSTEIVCRVKSEDGEVKKTTKLNSIKIPIGNGIEAGTFEVDLADYNHGKYILEVELGKTGIINSWDFWVYPAKVQMPDTGSIYITEDFDNKTIQKLESGETVLLLARREQVAGDMPQCFSSIYWNCPWTGGGESQTMGILCNPDHKLFESFATDYHSNWQWYELLVNARPMILDKWGKENSWPKDYRPLVQLINDWNTNKKLAVLAECRYAKGKMVICCMDIESNLENRIVARQFRYSLLNYMNSDNFDPQTTVRLKHIKDLFKNN